MRILIAPDSFKESMSALKVAETIKYGFECVYPEANYILLPIADGGEGTLDALVSAKKGKIRKAVVEGPLGELVTARWGLIEKEKTAIIELAEASGLELVPPNQRNVEKASTFGTGQLINEALDHNIDKIILCLGGSATNDAGAGIAQALGVKLFDANGSSLEPGGLALEKLVKIDRSEMNIKASKVTWEIACDVTNPLCGINGASAIFGPQKGASPKQVTRLDRALENFSQCASSVTGEEYNLKPGFGAAGGTPLGIALLSTISMQPGVEIVFTALQIHNEVEKADLVITGEGQMDYQSLFGKAPFSIAKLAKQHNVPTIGIAGSLGSNLTGLDEYFNAVFGTVRSPQTLSQVLSEAESNLFNTSKNVASMLKLSI